MAGSVFPKGRLRMGEMYDEDIVLSLTIPSRYQLDGGRQSHSLSGGSACGWLG